VRANLAAAAAPAASCAGKVFNIAGGRSWTLLDVLAVLEHELGVVADPVFVEPRAGDVRRSQADASAAARDLNVRCEVSLEDGLHQTVEWLRSLNGGPS
jgi:nucleoside-diphosphate-sugar epimerase